MAQSPNTGERLTRVALLRVMVSLSAIIDILAYALAGAAVALVLAGAEIPLALAFIGPLYDLIAVPSRRYAVRWAKDILSAHGFDVVEVPLPTPPTRKQRIKAAALEQSRVVPVTATNPSPPEPVGSRGRRL